MTRRRLLLWLAVTAMGLLAAGAAAVGLLYLYLAPTLPSVETLKDIRFQVPLRVYSADGRLLAEYGEQRRVPVRYEDVPPLMIQAFLAAEDDRFFEHPGVDWQGLLRAAFKLVVTGERGQGGGTITMQLPRDLLIGREKTFTRKLREILLALRIERELSKEEILTLYLNKIFLGQRAYGVGAAAEVYFGTDIHHLTLGQIALIAGLPQAPSRDNPITNPRRAAERRAYVLRRMLELGYIDKAAHDAALAEPVTATRHGPKTEVEAMYAGEMVRADLVARYGESVYTDGYRVVTTINSRLQDAANRALRRGLMEYDQRHGWRGPVARLALPEEAGVDVLDAALESYTPVGGLIPGIVTRVGKQDAEVYLGADRQVTVPWEGLSWARKALANDAVGPEPERAAEVLARGDIVYLLPLEDGSWRLSQIPRVQGALVALNPGDSAILALIGGFDFAQTKFNRAVQAKRQPGSAFKPFVYTAALDKGFTPATIVNDAPVVFEDATLEGTWRPENYTGRFHGPTRLREALVHSRNLVSIRVMHDIGVGYAIDYLQRFGFAPERLTRDLSLALGTSVMSPLELAAAYNIFANGGYRSDPYLIARVIDPSGKTVMVADPLLACDACAPETLVSPIAGAPAGERPLDAPADPAAAFTATPRYAERVLTPQTHYLIVDMMRDVVRRGTAARAMELGRGDLAGKTGTSNDYQDAWFAGFNRSLTAVVWVGYDELRSLGAGEVGGRTALPIWIEFMRTALAGVPESQTPMPPGLVSVRISPETGLLAGADDPTAMFEIFPADNVPARAPRSTPRTPDDPHQRPAEDDDDLF
ncbi:MAG TPA: penicillin-binding protein 1A [Gammaproteobacteria bacterium]|nr:penicillin-binding protein 1A [Gammaproteobacteria bacterium]